MEWFGRSCFLEDRGSRGRKIVESLFVFFFFSFSLDYIRNKGLHPKMIQCTLFRRRSNGHYCHSSRNSLSSFYFSPSFRFSFTYCAKNKFHFSFFSSELKWRKSTAAAATRVVVCRLDVLALFEGGAEGTRGHACHDGIASTIVRLPVVGVLEQQVTCL